MLRLARALWIAVAAAVVLIAGALPVSATSSDVYVGSVEGPVSVPGDNILHGIGGIVLPAGTWWVTATAVIDAGDNGTPGSGQSTCELIADDGSFSYRLDQATWALLGHPEGRAVDNVYLTATFMDSLVSTLSLECSSEIQSVSVSDLVMSAASVSANASPMFKENGANSASIAGGSGFHTVGSLSLPKGKWLIVAKANIVSSSSSQTTNEVCQLKLSTTDVDQSGQSMYYTTQQGYEGEAAVQVAHVFASAGSAALQCKGKQAAAANHIVLIGIKAGKLTRKPFGGTASTSGTGTPTIVSGYKAGSVAISAGSYGTIGSLALPAGKWLVQAKAFLKDGSEVRVDCQLTLGTMNDLTYSLGAAAGHTTGLYMQTAASLSSSGNAIFSCDAASTGPSVSYVRITAISASLLSFAI